MPIRRLVKDVRGQLDVWLGQLQGPISTAGRKSRLSPNQCDFPLQWLLVSQACIMPENQEETCRSMVTPNIAVASLPSRCCEEWVCRPQEIPCIVHRLVHRETWMAFRPQCKCPVIKDTGSDHDTFKSTF